MTGFLRKLHDKCKLQHRLNWCELCENESKRQQINSV